MEQCTEVFVEIDVTRARTAIAVPDGQRGRELRYLGEVDASAASMCPIISGLASEHERVHICYEVQQAKACAG